MTAHVAEAGEQRGRVVLKLGCTEPSRIALEAAVRIAQAFGSEIESLFVEEPQIFDAVSYPFVRETLLCGRQTRDVTPQILARQMRQVAHEVIQRVEALARRADVPTRSTMVRDEPVHALADVCRACGPWNVIALADATVPSRGEEIHRLFDEVADMTGVVFAGPRARTTQGPVVVALEDAAQLDGMLRAARRLLEPESGERVVVVLVADDETGLGELEAQVRLAVGGDDGMVILRAVPAHGSPLGPSESIRRLNGGFVIVELGGMLVPAEGSLRHLTLSLECPLFVVR